MHPKLLSIADFDYLLPAERIAKFPLTERDESKLLIYKHGETTTDIYRNIASHLPRESLLVFNDTRVVEARIMFQKVTGGSIEIFCLEPDESYTDISTAMLQKETVRWKCLIGGASKWKHGITLEKSVETAGPTIQLYASVVARQKDSFVIEFSWQPSSLTFAEVLHVAGLIPLPPYLHRDTEESDKERYQTVYAVNDGSVAAPTAGLHFTDAIFTELGLKNIRKLYITLHVGAGTFKPVKSSVMEDHEMHAEFIEISAAAINQISGQLGQPIVAVGTTSLRTLESLFWLGVKLNRKIENGYQNPEPGELFVGQWEPYENEGSLTPKLALDILLSWMKGRHLKRLITRTQILIAPGYRLKIATAIITNFHQPHSTLLLLVAAVIGNDWKATYEYAMENNFRFLSYGDGCLLYAKENEG